jgi:(p)ppGpp synthase/HD superfamily hydrolase
MGIACRAAKELHMTHPDLPATFLTARFAHAVAYASALHATQIRKGTRVPYIAHLLGVASLVLEADGDEDMAIGGLLHDAAEDQGGEARLHDIAARFGPTVAGYVRSCSDSLVSDRRHKRPWAERKRAYLDHLTQADVKTVTVSMADKVHNARSIITDLHNGIWVFEKFSASPTDTIWYYTSCLETAQTKDVSPALVTPLERAVQGMRDEVAAWPQRDAG